MLVYSLVLEIQNVLQQTLANDFDFVEEYFFNIVLLGRYNAGMVLSNRHSVPVSLFITRMLNHFRPHFEADMSVLDYIQGLSIRQAVNELEADHFIDKFRLKTLLLRVLINRTH